MEGMRRNKGLTGLALLAILALMLSVTVGTAATAAGGSAAEIASITGHSMRDVGAILDLYLARTGKIALAAIAKLERGKA